MADKLNLILSTLFLFSILFIFPTTTKSDDTCPYPCYPPPTGTGTPATPTTTTPSPPSQTGSYPPPGYYSPPGGYLPYNPPPPYGNNLYGVPPPPPDPILPYFPFYYKEPLYGQSSAVDLPRSMIIMTVSNLLAFVFVFLIM